MSPSPPTERCAICNRLLSVDPALRRQFQPFCSERCRQVDLMRWLDGKYAIIDPVSEDEVSPQTEIDEEAE